MSSVVDDVPWGNLFRTIVTTGLFFFVISFPVALFTSIDTDRQLWGAMLPFIAVVAFVLASVVVWSERVRWIGDD